jgi:hypothetical protein
MCFFFRLNVTDTYSSYNFVPSNYNDNVPSQPGPSSSAQAGPSFVPPFNYDDYNARNHGRYDAPESKSIFIGRKLLLTYPTGLYDHSLYPDDLSAYTDMSGTAPNPHHMQVPHLSDDDDDADPSPQPQYNPVVEGEIPESQVIHVSLNFLK